MYLYTTIIWDCSIKIKIVADLHSAHCEMTVTSWLDFCLIRSIPLKGWIFHLFDNVFYLSLFCRNLLHFDIKDFLVIFFLTIIDFNLRKKRRVCLESNRLDELIIILPHFYLFLNCFSTCAVNIIECSKLMKVVSLGHASFRKGNMSVILWLTWICKKNNLSGFSSW